MLIEPGHVYNAPIVAGNVSPAMLSPYCNGIPASARTAARAILHDKVKAICPSDDGYGGTVTIELTTGFSFGKPVLYLRYADIQPQSQPTVTATAITHSRSHRRSHNPQLQPQSRATATATHSHASRSNIHHCNYDVTYCIVMHCVSAALRHPCS